jgi:SAM-dependent methyltransferase
MTSHMTRYMTKNMARNNRPETSGGGSGVDWDAAAAAFDDEADHGLRDPVVRDAWDARMGEWLPRQPGDVLDLGCGTGSLSLLAAERGHRVTGVDLSPAMVALARAKLAGRDAVFLVGDAAAPPVGEQLFDVILVRHVLWALPDPGRALRHWRGLLRPSGISHVVGSGGGRLVLVEGVWGTTSPVGVPADRLTALLAPLVRDMRVERLSHDARLWGKEVDDERYAVVAVT